MRDLVLADIAGPFYDPTKPFRNWSSLPFAQLDLPTSPYVDQAQLDTAVARAMTHLGQLQAQGYSGIVIDNLAHLTGFETSGDTIYPLECAERQRASRYRMAFTRLFDAAATRGMMVFVTTDMQWSTAPLRRYAGRLAIENARLVDANRRAVAELFTIFPQVRGLVVRVGETGGAHDTDDYTGTMLYRTPAALRALIDSLLPICERYNRLLIVRTWSVGIGTLGDLLWSPTRYRQVFSGYASPHLLVSIKHTPSDFFRRLPPNPTLGLPGPRQIVELQNRREYELFGMVPSGVTELHGAAIRHSAAAGVAGVWAWNATGGWGGGTTALGSGGWSLWTELSSALTAALINAPETGGAFVRSWCTQRLGPAFGTAAAELYLDSERLIERGWYLGPLGAQATLGGMRIPPLSWVWWMRPTAAPLIWADLATAVMEPALALQESHAAVERAAAHAVRLADLAVGGGPEAAFVVESARYLWDVLAVAHAIRVVMLPAFTAATQIDRVGWRRAVRTADLARATLRRHREAWEDRRDFPALEVDEIDAFFASLQRAPDTRWLQARTACRIMAQVRAGRPSKATLYTGGMVAAATLALALGQLRHSPMGLAGACAPLLFAAPPVRDRALRAGLPWLNRHLFLLPSIFFEAGPALNEWL